MAKKVTKAMGNVFSEVNQYADIFGREQVQKSNILVDAIRPDPEQPRSLLPADLDELLLSGEDPVRVLHTWLTRANEAHAEPTLKKNIEDLIHLAGTIEQHGLINPITIRENSEENYSQYLIVTGERRWWAHVYLLAQNKQVKGRTAEEIDATIVTPDAIRAIQLIENISRSDLTAYERAIGVQALYDELKTQKIRAPWTRVEELLSISRSHRVRILHVLQLSSEAQEIVQQYGLSENAIRPIADKLLKKPDLQLEALKQLVSWQQANEESGHARLSAYVQKLLAPPKVKATSSFEATHLAGQFGKQISGTLKMLNKLESTQESAMMLALSQNKSAITALRQLQEKLNHYLSEIE